MKLHSAVFTLAGASLAALANAFSENCYHCKEDNCLRAVMGQAFPGRNGKGDCNSYWLTTTTPHAVTKSITKTVTVTPTSIEPVTATNTVDQTATTVISLIQTQAVDVTTTDLVDQTATTTITVTTTVSDLNNQPVAKRSAARQPSIPSYASACSGTARYSSACSCVGATHRTVTAVPATVTSTVTTTVTGNPNIIPTTVQTVSVTVTVTTVPVTTTFSTALITSVVATELLSTTVLTQTSTATATATANAYNFNMYFNFLTDTSNTNNYGHAQGELDGNTYLSEGTMAQEDSFHLSDDGTLTLTSGIANLVPGVTFTGGWDGPNSDDHGNYIMFESFPAYLDPHAVPLSCTITSDLEFLCIYDTDTGAYGDWWDCGVVALVEPGYDYSANCQGESGKITITAQLIS